MPTIRVAVQVLAADKAAVESYLSTHGSYPLGVQITTYPGDPSETATNYGAAISCVTGSALETDMLAIPGLFPGAAVNPVQYTPPYWKAWNVAVHWAGWLNSQGLQPRVP